MGAGNPQFFYEGTDVPVKNRYIYFDLPGTPEGTPAFEVEFEFLTDDDGRIGHVDDPEGSANLIMGQEYNVYYSSERITDTSSITEDMCQLMQAASTMYLRAKVLNLTIKDPAGNPKGNFPIKVVRHGTEEEFTGETDEEGRCTFCDLPPGDYFVKPNRQTAAGDEGVEEPGTEEETEEEEEVVQASEEEEQIEGLQVEDGDLEPEDDMFDEQEEFEEWVDED